MSSQLSSCWKKIPSPELLCNKFVRSRSRLALAPDDHLGSFGGIGILSPSCVVSHHGITSKGARYLLRAIYRGARRARSGNQRPRNCFCTPLSWPCIPNCCGRRVFSSYRRVVMPQPMPDWNRSGATGNSISVGRS
jgi:hypothetical protein